MLRCEVKATRLGLRNSTTRVPFRYGAACLRSCPQAVLEAVVEVDGHVARGYAGDCLPPGWFDKTPGVDYERQIADLLAAIAMGDRAMRAASEGGAPAFRAWWDAYRAAQDEAPRRGLNPLVATFGLSLVERATMDAVARHAGVGLSRALREDLYGIEPGLVHAELKGTTPRDWLPEVPLLAVFVRHTVGLGDPLTTAEVAPGERVADGLPQSVEEHIARDGVRYFKVKLSNQLDRDRERLLALARVIESTLGDDYRLTLDGNEQYTSEADFDAFLAMLQGTPALATLRGNVLAIEQPLGRAIALDPRHTEAIRRLNHWRPVIIDESDATVESYPRAIEVGYRGVSFKNCKGPFKGILNAGLTWLRNGRGRDGAYLMTGEDLCSVGVVPVQADLCLAATLGLHHVERNGHHYHPGLSYLPERARRSALAAHPDFYEDRGGVVGPAVRNGQFRIGSLHEAPGFGFAALPDLDDFTTAAAWDFTSLGLG
jgi:L-alanine-DL-glutamate epimerase-like enolase superfamily enzyme